MDGICIRLTRFRGGCTNSCSGFIFCLFVHTRGQVFGRVKKSVEAGQVKETGGKGNSCQVYVTKDDYVNMTQAGSA